MLMGASLARAGKIRDSRYFTLHIMGGLARRGTGIQGIVARRAEEFRDLARRASKEGNAVQGYYRKR